MAKSAPGRLQGFFLKFKRQIGITKEVNGPQKEQIINKINEFNAQHKNIPVEGYVEFVDADPQNTKRLHTIKWAVDKIGVIVSGVPLELQGKQL